MIQGTGFLDAIDSEDTGFLDGGASARGPRPQGWQCAMRPLRDFTDDEWKGILEARSKFVNGKPDAKGAYVWLRSQPDSLAIQPSTFEARVAVKLLETNWGHHHHHHCHLGPPSQKSKTRSLIRKCGM